MKEVILMLLATSSNLYRMVPIRRLSLPSRATNSAIGETKVHVGSSHTGLKRGPGERDITSVDLLEERIRKKSSARDSTFGGQRIFWNYRSEVVDKLGLDDKHKNIGIAYAVIIVLGFTAFVYVKSEVILNRKEEMEERHRIKRELKMRGENDNSGNKKLAVADS